MEADIYPRQCVTGSAKSAMMNVLAGINPQCTPPLPSSSAVPPSHIYPVVSPRTIFPTPSRLSSSTEPQRGERSIRPRPWKCVAVKKGDGVRGRRALYRKDACTRRERLAKDLGVSFASRENLLPIYPPFYSLGYSAPREFRLRNFFSLRQLFSSLLIAYRTIVRLISNLLSTLST
ncbi:hypothetical protein WH47_03746 [Habropoda laboriosa]|uniref:Uncharacterized protein n=1 Tax=Habropoda laboriosa TaxID=597456 RepID=A0A0L7QVW9_9HYME|nr:hypothetical protein WH47_03746 [Habropoda laboriosa]